MCGFSFLRDVEVRNFSSSIKPVGFIRNSTLVQSMDKEIHKFCLIPRNIHLA